MIGQSNEPPNYTAERARAPSPVIGFGGEKLGARGLRTRQCGPPLDQRYNNSVYYSAYNKHNVFSPLI